MNRTPRVTIWDPSLTPCRDCRLRACSATARKAARLRKLRPPSSAPGSGSLQFAQDDKKISVSHRGCRGRQPLHSHRQSSSLVVGAGVPDGPFHGFSQLLVKNSVSPSGRQNPAYRQPQWRNIRKPACELLTGRFSCFYRPRRKAVSDLYFFFLPKMPLEAPSSSPMEAANWRSNSFWEELRFLGTATLTETNWSPRPLPRR